MDIHSSDELNITMYFTQFRVMCTNNETTTELMYNRVTYVLGLSNSGPSGKSESMLCNTIVV